MFEDLARKLIYEDLALAQIQVYIYKESMRKVQAPISRATFFIFAFFMSLKAFSIASASYGFEPISASTSDSFLFLRGKT